MNLLRKVHRMKLLNGYSISEIAQDRLGTLYRQEVVQQTIWRTETPLQAQQCPVPANFGTKLHGDYSRVTYYDWRRQHGAGIIQAFVSLQFGWGEERLVVGGILHKLQVAHAKLCASRAYWLIAYPTQGSFCSGRSADLDACHTGLWLTSPQRCVHLQLEKRQDPSGHSHRFFRHSAAWQEGALSFHRGSGQCAGAGEDARQSSPDCGQSTPCRSGDSR